MDSGDKMFEENGSLSDVPQWLVDFTEGLRHFIVRDQF
jgi:hypothetical protein